MRNLKALTLRELQSLFLAPSLHLVTAFFVLLYGLVFVGTAYQQGTADFNTVSVIVCFMAMLLVPLITMRSFAEESASGTLELLLTAPVSSLQVVLSKFAGALIFFCTTLLPLAVHVSLLSWCGRLDWAATLVGLLGLGLTGALFTAIGVLVSSMTSSQAVAAAVACVVNLVLLFLSWAAESDVSWLRAVGYASFVPHFQKSFLAGLIDTRALVYYFSATVGLLYLTWLRLEARGARLQREGAARRTWSLLAGLAFAAGLLAALGGVTWLHVAGVLDRVLAANPQGENSDWTVHLLPFLLAGGLLAAAAWALGRSRGGRDGGLLGLLRQDGMGAVLLGGVAGLVILVNVNYLAAYPAATLESEPAPLSYLATLRPRIWDLTENKANTLSPHTCRALDELTARVDITVFYSVAISYENVPVVDETKRLLERFHAYNSLVNYRFVDAELDRSTALALSEQMDLGIPPEHLIQMAVVTYDDRRALVPAGMLLKQPEGYAQLAGKKQYGYNGELAFAIALRRLLDPRTTRVYFTDGHGEYRIGSNKPEPLSVGRLAEALQQETFDVRRWMAKDEPVPEDCDVLILPGPRLPLGEGTIQRIRDYTERGGRVLVLLAPALPLKSGEAAPPMEPALRNLMTEWGATPRGDLLFDHTNCYERRSLNPLVLPDQGHPVSRGIRRCALPAPQSLHEATDAHERGWIMQRLLATYPTAGSQYRSDEGVRTRNGEQLVGFASARRPDPDTPEARVIVIGSVEFAGNLSIDFEQNREFLINAVGWLAGRDYMLPIEPPEYIDRSLKMTPSQQRFVAWVSLCWLPLAWLLLAGAVWWMRKE